MFWDVPLEPDFLTPASGGDFAEASPAEKLEVVYMGLVGEGLMRALWAGSSCRQRFLMRDQESRKPSEVAASRSSPSEGIPARAGESIKALARWALVSRRK